MTMETQPRATGPRMTPEEQQWNREVDRRRNQHAVRILRANNGFIFIRQVDGSQQVARTREELYALLDEFYDDIEAQLASSAQLGNITVPATRLKGKGR